MSLCGFREKLIRLQENAMSSSYKQGWDAQFLITQFFSYSVTQNYPGKHVFMMRRGVVVSVCHLLLVVH